MPGVYTVVGDSNLRRHMNPQNIGSRPYMVGAQIKTCSSPDTLGEVLRSIRAETTICILACLTNMLTSIDGDSASAGLRVQPVLTDIKETLLDYCQENPERSALIYFVYC